jgi:hypothetical protein
VMSWFLNKYHCPLCGSSWEDEWSATVDDKCPVCGRNYSPEDSEDLTIVVQRIGVNLFVVLESPSCAEDRPMYRERFLGTEQQANRYKDRLDAGD